MISAFAELDEAARVAIIADPERPLGWASKLRVCGEYHLLLNVRGELFLGEFRAKERSIEFRFLREDVADFDTEGNRVYLVTASQGELFQGKNGSIGEWIRLFEDSGVKFEKICCNNNGLLLTSGDGTELYAQGDFGSLLKFEDLTKVDELAGENVVQISAGIDFVILASQKTKKVMTDIKKDPFYDRYCLSEEDPTVYYDWRNFYKNCGDRFKGDLGPIPEAVCNVNVDSAQVFGQMIHETGVVSFGKVNKGQLGTSDHIRRDKLVHLQQLFNVAKITTCCDYSAALTVDGSLFLWGDTNQKNQASLDSRLTLVSGSSPTLFGRFRNVLDVCSGNFCSYVVTSDLRIHDVRSDERSLGYEVGGKASLGVEGLEDVPLVVASDSLIVVNHMPVNREGLRVYGKEQVTIQALLKHFRENGLGGIPKKTLNTLSPHYFYRSCTRLFYLLLLNLRSLHAFLFEGDLKKIVAVMLHEEMLFLYRRIIKCYCDSDCLGLMHEPEQHLLQIYLDNVKNYIELIELLVNANKSLEEPVENRLLNAKSEWLKFFNEEVTEEMGKLVKVTKEFWASEENFRWQSLKEAHRRVILDSAEVPLKFLDVAIFSSSPRIVLFSDVLCYLSGVQVIEYPLDLIWVSTDIKETAIKNRHKEKLRFLINIITPEEVLRTYTLNSADKLIWLNALKTQMMRVLRMDATAKQPMYRCSRYRFNANRHPKFAGSQYEGIWKMGHIDGIGELSSGKDRIYRGELYRGDITGYGCLQRTQYGIGSVYEGDFFEGKFDGYGKLKSTNVTASQYFKYRGYFRADKYNGFGTLLTSSYQYNGDFVNDLKEGFGVVDDIQNGVKYIGMFANDRKFGNGILITTNGTYYAGLFANDTLSNSAGGLAIFPSGIYYKGELTIEGPCGKGVFYYPEKEIGSETFELDDTNVQMSGHTMTGTFAGTWDSVKISNGSMAMDQRFNKVPVLDLKINAERKWSTIFSCFHQSVFGTSDITKLRSMDVKKIWNKIAIYITRAKRKEQLKSNNFEVKLTEFDDQSAARICQTGFRLTNLSTTSLRSSFSDSKLSLTTNGTPNGSSNDSAMDNISIRSFTSMVSREYDDEFMLNPTSRGSPFRDLEIIPDFCITTVDGPSLQLLRDYLSEAFRNTHHPLHQLFDKLSNCFYSTYSCWKFTPNSILCEPAMNEWISIVSRIYTLVLTVMFPALPKDSAIVDGELLSYQTLLYPILMTQGIYSALFVLYASKCCKNDEIYRQRILICEKKTDENLIQLLDINRDLIPIIRSSRYQEAIDSLNLFKEKCCPSEMMKHINEAFTLVDVASKEQDSNIAADSLLELVILLIIKANIPQLGAEISLLEDLLQNDVNDANLSFHSSTQNDYCLTTLKASYQHIISDNFFVNKIFDGTGGGGT